MEIVHLNPVERIDEETLKLVLDIYEEACIKEFELRPPEIEYVYKVVKARWLDETYDFICANEDTFGINIRDITSENLVSYMHDIGFEDFVMPSYDKVYRILNYFHLSYVSSQQIINNAVVEVW